MSVLRELNRVHICTYTQGLKGVGLLTVAGIFRDTKLTQRDTHACLVSFNPTLVVHCVSSSVALVSLQATSSMCTLTEYWEPLCWLCFHSHG